MDGAKPSDLVGTDLRQPFIDLGYTLFSDRSTLQTPMIAADFLDASPASPISPYAGTMDLIHACSFYHVFNHDEQMTVCTRSVNLLGSQGGIIFGSQPGGLVEGSMRTDDGGRKERYRHSAESWAALWRAVGDQLGLVLDVDVEQGGQKDHEGRGLRFVIRVPHKA